MDTAAWRGPGAFLFRLLWAIALALPVAAGAANKTFTGPGSFSDTTKWNGGSLPGTGDTLRINGNCIVDVSTGVAYGPLNVGFASPSTLSWSGNNTLNVTTVSSNTAGSAIDMTNGGTLQIRTSWTTTNQTFTPGTGTINWNVTGAPSALPSAITAYNSLTITSATRIVSLGVGTSVNGNLTIASGTLADAGLQLVGNGTGTLTMNSGATLTLGNGAASTSFPTNFTNFALDPASTVTYQSTGAQTVSGAPTYGNLIINKTGATGTLGANTSVAGALTISNGTLSTSGSNFSLSVTSDITGAGGLTGNASTISVGGNMTVTTFTAGTSTVVYNGSGAQTAGGTYTYNNLTINKSAGTATLGAAATVNGNLTITSGTLADGGRQIAGNNTGTLTMAANTTLTIGSGATNTTFPTNFANANITLATSSTVTYQSTGAQTIKALSGSNPYGNLTLIKGAGTGTLAAATDVAGTLTITSGTLNTSAASSFALNVTGSIAGAGTLTGNASAIAVGGDMTVTTFTAPTGASNVTFNGTGSQQVGGTYTFRTLTINKSSGTATLGGATTVNVKLDISSGTLADGGFQLAGNAAGTMSMGANTFLLVGSGATNTSFPTNFPNAGITLNASSTVTYQSTGAQTVKALSGSNPYGNLTLIKGAGTGTLAAATDVAGTLTITSGTLTTSASNFALNVTGGITGLGTLTGNASAITVGGDMTVTTFSATTTSNVTFNGTGAQQVGGTYTFRTLTINKTAGTATLGGLTTVDVKLDVSQGTLADGGFQITGNSGGTMSMGANTFLLLGTATNTSFPTNFLAGSIALNATSTVTYQSTGAQTVSGVPGYGNLTINKTGATGTLGANTVVAGALTVSAGTVDTSGSNFTLSVTGSITGTGGTLTSNASAVTVGGDMTVTTFTAPTGASNVTFNGSGAQQIGGAYTFRTLTINKSAGTATLGGSTSVGVDLVITAGTLSSAGANLAIAGSITGGGTLSAGSSAISVGGNMTVTGFSAGTSTVQFNGTGAQTVGGAYSFANLSINKASGTATLGGLTSVTGNLTLTAGTLDDAGFQITGNATGALNMASGTSLSLGTAGTGTAFPSGFAAGTLNAASTVTYASGAAQTVSTALTYGNLTFSGAGTKTGASGTLTIAGDWNIGSTTSLAPNSTSVTLTGSGKAISGSGGVTFTTLTVSGSYTNNSSATLTVNTALSGSGTLTQGTNAALVLKGTVGISTLTATANPNTITYNGASSQAAKAATYHHLTVDNASGITLGSGDITVNGTLTLTTGKITTNANVVIIPDGGSVTGSSSARYVFGNLRKNFKAAVTSHAFEVGDASKYVPVTIAFVSVSTAGNLTVNATGTPHPDITNSGLAPSESASRYWTVTSDGTLAFTTYSATLDYTNDPPFGGVTDFSVYGISKADSCAPPCAWSFPTTVATNANTAQANGMNSFSDFGVGHRVDHFVFNAPGSATQGTGFAVTITAVDKNGSTVTGFTGTATITSTNGNCTITAGGTTSAFIAGVYTGNVTISNACTDTLKATQVGNSGVTGTSSSVTVAAAISSFNAFETSTAANAITGQIYTKLAGAPFDLAIVGVVSGAQATGFNGDVKLELLFNTTVAGCAASTNILQTINSFHITGGRSSTTGGQLNVANAYRDVRVRVTCNSTNCPPSGITSCSADNFSIRPGSFSVTSTNATNTGTSGTPQFKTGASFNLNADPGRTNYDGTPSLDNTKVVGTSTAGTIGGSFSAATGATSGVAVGSSFTYSEVGNFGLNTDAVVDSSFTSVDQPNDCTNDTSTSLAGGKYGCKIGSTAVAAGTGLGFGRFIPDHFALTAAGSMTQGCNAGGFSYLGQGMQFSGITLEARNSSDAKTSNYAGAYAKLDPTNFAALNFGARDTAGAGTNLSTRISGTLAGGNTWSAGAVTLTVTSLTIARNATPDGSYAATKVGIAPSDPDDSSIKLKTSDLNVDVDGDSTNDHARIGGADTSWRFGRLRILPATGIASLPLDVSLRAEYWNGTTFIKNGDDSCTQIARANVKQSAYQGPLAACDTIISTTPVTLSLGTGTLRLTTPSGGHAGSVTLTPQLGATAGTFCNSVGGGTAATSSAGLSYLLGKWNNSANYDQDPSARAAFGVYGSQPKNYIFFRENY